MFYDNEMINFQTNYREPYNNFDLLSYGTMNYNNENKSTDFYGGSFLEASNSIKNNPQRVNNDAPCINIITIKNKLSANHKRKVISPEKQRKKLLVQKLKIYFQQMKDNYLKMKKKKFIKEDLKIFSKKETVHINNIFISRYLYIKETILLAKSLIIKTIFPFRE